MINNLTNINKTNHQLLPKIIGHKKDHNYDVGNPGPGLEQAQKCDRLALNQHNVSQQNSISTHELLFQ